MKRSAHTQPVSDIDSHMAEIARELNTCHESMIATKNGEASQVIIGVQCHRALEGTLALLKLLALGTRQANARLVRSADAVFADLDALDS
jgi:hypothetical protein